MCIFKRTSIFYHLHDFSIPSFNKFLLLNWCKIYICIPFREIWECFKKFVKMKLKNKLILMQNLKFVLMRSFLNMKMHIIKKLCMYFKFLAIKHLLISVFMNFLKFPCLFTGSTCLDEKTFLDLPMY